MTSESHIIFKSDKASCSVLLIENNIMDAEVLSLLMGPAQLPVVLYHAKDGEEALHLLECSEDAHTLRPHMVLLDLGLPKYSGLEVLKRIKGNESLDATKILIFTSSGDPTERARCLDLGADAFYRKPWGLRGYSDFVKGALSDEIQLALKKGAIHS